MIIDGLVVAHPNRQLFEAMKEGGLTACNFTCCIWEGLEETIRNVAEWKQMLSENSDLITLVRTTDDIISAGEQGKVGIILGWQNSTGFGDYIPNVRLYHELGLRVVQLTYNSANSVGVGCYETVDGGLTDFGRMMVAELNDAGVLVDLSHVGRKTALETMEIATRPPAYTHCCPTYFLNHPRNKTDEELKAIADKGGFVGAAAVPHFLPKGTQTTVDDYVDLIIYMRNIVGAGSIGLGTDLVQGRTPEFFDYITRDKGTGKSVAKPPEFPIIQGFKSAADYGNIRIGLEKKLTASDVDRVLSQNWLGFLKEIWV